MVVDLDVERGKPFVYKPEQTGVLVPQELGAADDCGRFRFFNRITVNGAYSQWRVDSTDHVVLTFLHLFHLVSSSERWTPLPTRRAMRSQTSRVLDSKPARKEGPCLCSASADTLGAHATGAGGRLVAAMGGMSAMIPIKGDEAANKAAMNRILADKLREITAGHDGSWIAHPLINKIVFDKYMHGPNQYSYARCPYSICGGACRRRNGGRDVSGGPGVDPRLFGVFGNWWCCAGGRVSVRGSLPS
ncbi:hypothetical protein EXIGLDRAFT_773635 [Exidia glandulosa HHB12029]|uniref:malate synthase n=1 Tax=Exidia glandulosa HHB12029 TaxID=1314781 RepID=A0A165EPN9_EXIGL|nr:hypothetical protein EXIGLDRAFT_773635 [Exidia glandulosa HHB12029]